MLANDYMSVTGFLEIMPRPKKAGGRSESWPGGPVNLYADTLARVTTLGISTATHLDLPLDQFDVVETNTINGPTKVRRIPDVQLTLPGGVAGDARIPLPLSEIHVMDPTLQPMGSMDLSKVPDILGTDVLSRGVLCVNWVKGEGWLYPANLHTDSVHYFDSMRR